MPGVELLKPDRGEHAHQRIDEDLIGHEGHHHQHAEQQARPAHRQNDSA